MVKVKEEICEKLQIIPEQIYTIGRKNCLFTGSLKGTKASCSFFSLIKTAKQNDLNPDGYLKWIFETIMSKDKSLILARGDWDEIQKHVFSGWRN